MNGAYLNSSSINFIIIFIFVFNFQFYAFARMPSEVPFPGNPALVIY